ncbi:MAG: tRNA pseudouridine(13) synthase TruD [Planctomycetota bacterium]|jgi:tRNA pseudouridine13 synthase
MPRLSGPQTHPRISSSVAGVGGTLRQHPEDFLVEEIPLYSPSGSGEHRYLLIEKRGLPTLEATSILTRHMGVRRRDVGYAGLKDKHAVTRQWISVYDTHAKNTDLATLRDERIAILEESRHANKLRRGHLRGNRFSITIREPVGTLDQASRTLDLLASHGVPNRFGEQRFGIRGNNHILGRAIILERYDEFLAELLGPTRERRGDSEARELYTRGDYARAINAFPRGARAECLVLKALVDGLSGRAIINRVDETSRMFWISAFQSHIFNHVLDQRLESETLDTLRLGDIATLMRDGKGGSTFPVTQEDLDDPRTPQRLKEFDLSPTGPLWGARMTRASGDVDRIELEALDATGVGLDDLLAFSRLHSDRLMKGDRRPLRIPLMDASCEPVNDERGDAIRCHFSLPPGAFATTVMDEIMQPAHEAS